MSVSWLDILKFIGPTIVAAVVPHGRDLAPIIVDAITAAEQLKGATGADKKAHALTLVEQGAAGANAVAGKTLIDPKEAASTAGVAIDAVVKTVNLIRDVKAA